VSELTYLIYDTNQDFPAWAGDDAQWALQALPWGDRDSVPAGARVVLYLGDEQVRDVAPLALERRWQVGLLPHPDANQSCAALGVSGKPEELLAHYNETEPLAVDVLTCNDELVFSSVVIGRVLTLRPYDINRPQTRWSFFSGALRALGKLRLAEYRLTTAKERKIRLAAVGLIVLSHTQSRLLGRNFIDNFNVADGRLSMLALAPRSILGYLWFMLRLMLPNKFSLEKLPGSIALVETNHLLLQTDPGCEYLLDGKPVHANEIEFRILEQRLELLPGPALIRQAAEPSGSDKEKVRLQHVPVDETATAMAGKPLPMFSHASEGEYRDLFLSLRDSASSSSSYQVLMVLSVLLALTGMYANSAPVIIGAMILAPLMSPVISLAMGLARTEAVLIRTALKTLGIGVAWGLSCAVLLALAMPLDNPTPEMRLRMAPTLLDLLIAIVSGVAGAYAHAKEEIAKSLAGVAIAVALVPPLSVAGIGIGWADWNMAWGASLLLMTNLVGIALAASVTFLVLGFAPFQRVRKGLMITFAMMLAISIPLYIAFQHLVQRDDILEQVPRGSIVLAGVEVEVGRVRVEVGSPHLVRVVLSSRSRLSAVHVDELKQRVESQLGQPIQLEAQMSLRR
jgi:uncharacterized hydrophobic protein (TIGR00271 family)